MVFPVPDVFPLINVERPKIAGAALKVSYNPLNARGKLSSNQLGMSLDVEDHA